MQLLVSTARTRKVCLLALVTLFFLTFCALHSDAEVRTSANFSDGGHPFVFASHAELLRRVSTLYTPRPLLLLITEASDQKPATVAARTHVRKLAEQLPASFASVREFRIHNATDRSIAYMLAYSGSGNAELILQASALGAAALQPGIPSQLHNFVPLRCDADLTNVPALRRWMMANAADAYMNPVTLALQPSMRFVSDTAEVRRVLLNETSESSFSSSSHLSHLTGGTSPDVVAVAYVRLTTRGSAEIVAALSAVAAQAGSRVLLLATESTVVAEEWGMKANALNTLAFEPYVAVRQWYAQQEIFEEGGGSAAPTADNLSSVISVVSEELTVATAGEYLMKAVGASMSQSIAGNNSVSNLSPSFLLDSLQPPSVGSQQILDRWRQDMFRYRTTSPLRKLTSTAQLREAFAQSKHALRIVFFLRESDDMNFARQHRLAVELAVRTRSMEISYNAPHDDVTAAGAKSRAVSSAKQGSSRQVRFTPIGPVEVFWVDAERQQDFTSRARVTTVPSVALFFMVAVPGRRGTLTSEVIEPQGAHVLSRFDLHTADFSTSLQPTSADDARAAFPESADQVLRCLAGPRLHERLLLKTAMMESSALQLQDEGAQAGKQRGVSSAGREPASNGGGRGNRDDERGALMDWRDNMMYYKLDRRYYPVSVVSEPSAFIKNLVLREAELPAEKKEKGRRAGQEEKDGDAPVSSSATPRNVGSTKYAEELAKREAARAARIQAKAARDAAARKAAQSALKAEVEEALQKQQQKEEEEEENAKRHSIVAKIIVPRPQGVKTARTQEGVRRKGLLKQHLDWERESALMSALHAGSDVEGNVFFKDMLEVQ